MADDDSPAGLLDTVLLIVVLLVAVGAVFWLVGWVVRAVWFMVRLGVAVVVVAALASAFLRSRRSS